MIKKVDVAILGAGSASLFVLREIKKVTNTFVLIDTSPLGTTCARVGCMPSKLLVQEYLDTIAQSHIFPENKSDRIKVKQIEALADGG